MSIALNASAMDPRLEDLLKQASREDGIPVVFVTRPNRPLWLIMPEKTGLDGWHWKSDQARWLNALGVTHNYVETPFVGHWELPHAWRVPLGDRLLNRFHGYYVVERFESAEASNETSASRPYTAARCWTQVNWKNHKLQYRLVTKLDESHQRRERKAASR